MAEQQHPTSPVSSTSSDLLPTAATSETEFTIRPSTTESSLANQADIQESDIEMSRSIVGAEYGSEGFPFRQISHNTPPNSSPKSHKQKVLLAAYKDGYQLTPEVSQALEAADAFIISGNNKEAIPWLEKILESTRSPELHCLLWRLLGNAHFTVGNFKKASVCHLHNMAFCKDLQDASGVARANCNLGIAYMELGAFKLAGRCFLEYLEVSRTLGNETGVASACSNLGVLSKTVALKDLETMQANPSDSLLEVIRAHLFRGISYFEEHLSIVERYGDFPKVCRAYGNTGQCYEMLQQYPQAMFCHQKRLEIARQLGDKVSEARAMCNIGNCLRLIGNLEEAKKLYKENLECSREINDLPGESIALLNLGIITETLEQLEDSQKWYTLYLALVTQQLDIHGQIRAYECLGRIYEGLSDHRKSHNCFEKVAELTRITGDKNTHISAKQQADLAKKELKMQKKNKGLRGTLRRLTKGSLRLADPSLGQKSPMYRAESIELDTMGDSPMLKQRRKSAPQQGTWSPGLKRWFKTSPMPDWIPRQPAWEKSPPPGSSSPLIIANRKASAPQLQQDPSDDVEVEVQLRHHPEDPFRAPLPTQESSTNNPVFLDNLLLESSICVEPTSELPSDSTPHVTIKVNRSGSIYNRVRGDEHADTLKKLTNRISRPPEELGFHDISDEWKGWVLATQDEDDDLNNSVDLQMFEPKDGESSQSSSGPNPKSSPGPIPKSLDLFQPLTTPKC